MRTLFALLCVLTVVAHGAADAASPAPRRTIQNLVSSNGYGTLQLSLAGKRFDRLLQHPYKYEREGVATRDLLVDAYFGASYSRAASPRRGWMPEATFVSADPVIGTAVLRAVGHLNDDPDVVVTTYGFAPRRFGGTAFVLIAQIENGSDVALQDVSLYSVVNQRLGGERPEPSGEGEYIQYNLAEGGFEEFGPFGNSAAAGIGRPLGAVARRTSGGGGDETSFATNPYKLLQDGVQFSDSVDDPNSVLGYNSNDLAYGYQWSFGALAPGETRVAGVVVAYDHGNIAADAWGRMNDWLGAIDPRDAEAPRAVLDRELAAWADASTAAAPAAMSAAERDVYRQSVAILHMAQVQESGQPFGQILAAPAASTSVEYNQWNITWVRDMAYSTVALAESGQHAAARAALEFQLRADVGKYTQPEYVGRPYQISMCRYFGNGVEESDENQDGLNIEFDGFGLFLWSLGRYVAVSGDTSLLTDYWPLLTTEVADVLVALLDPYSGLVRADSSIWEVHWNGKQRQFAYTSITASAGLCAMADLARAVGQEEAAAQYARAGRQVRKAIGERLVDGNGVIAASVEELQLGANYADAAVLEAMAMGVIDPQSEVARATLDYLLANLSVGGPSSGRGLFRNDEGGDYDQQEWIVLNMRAIVALELSGRPQDKARADALWAWVLAQTSANSSVIAELYDKALTGDAAHAYAGSIPMAGFGAGAYILTALRRFGVVSHSAACGDYALEAVAEPVAEDPDAEPEAEPDTPSKPLRAGGCQSAGQGPDAWSTYLLMSLCVALYVGVRLWRGRQRGDR